MLLPGCGYDIKLDCLFFLRRKKYAAFHSGHRETYVLLHAMERKAVQYVTASLTQKLCKLTRDRLDSYSTVTCAALDFPQPLPCHPTSFVLELRRRQIKVVQMK